MNFKAYSIWNKLFLGSLSTGVGEEILYL